MNKGRDAEPYSNQGNTDKNHKRIAFHIEGAKTVDKDICYWLQYNKQKSLPSVYWAVTFLKNSDYFKTTQTTENNLQLELGSRPL